MWLLRKSLNVLLLFGMIFGVHGQQCGRYYQNDGICVNYKSNDDYVLYAEGQNLLEVEKSFNSLAIAQGLSTLREDDLILNNCVQAFTSFVCATSFLKCDQTSNATNLEVEIVPACLSTCTNVLELCVVQPTDSLAETKGIIANYILSSPFFPQDCTKNITTPSPLNFGYATENCNNSPQLSDRPKCFEPLIEDRKWVETNKSQVTDKRFCQRGCCLPCPQSYALYPSKYLDTGFLVTQILRTVSAVGSGIMLISYLVLPEKRTHPSILILFASFSIFLYSSNVFFSIFRPETIQCADKIVPSTQDNNLLCGIQGALLIFSSHATAIWIGFIILNLHVHTVWNSNIVREKYIYLHIIGWGVPALLTVVAIGTDSISYQFATLCLVKVKASNMILFYPLAFIVIPSFFMHMSTFFYICRVSIKRESKGSEDFSEFMTYRRHVVQAVRIQWRALLLSVILLATVLFYWIFYFVELDTIASSTNNLNFFNDWATCIQSGKGQDFCSKDVAMPPFKLLLAAEISTSLIGIYLIVIFFNEILWLEWSQWISEKFGPSRQIEISSQFYPI